MKYDPTPEQALLLFALLARHGACSQAQLMPPVKKADREALASTKLIDVGKVGRGFSIALSDMGWAWVAAHLSAELPPAQRTLSDMLARLGEHLARSNVSLADFIGAKPEATPPPKLRKSRKPPKPTQKAMRERIEVAYLKITGDRKDEAVRLSQLRAELSDLDRPTVDAALSRILRGDKKASLMRHDDPKQLSRTDHDAAFDPGGEPYHVIWIAS